MGDMEVNEADLAEQAQDPEGGPPVVEPPALGTEVPEADAVEQALGDQRTVVAPTLGVEVPEADAIDQAHAVEGDDEDRD
jgi:hypothetical protein